MGNNLVNISFYIADANARVLPLLGGDSSGHDWYNLLSGWGLLEQDRLLAQIVHTVGVIALIGSLLWLAVMVLASFNKPGQADAHQ